MSQTKKQLTKKIEEQSRWIIKAKAAMRDAKEEIETLRIQNRLYLEALKQDASE